MWRNDVNIAMASDDNYINLLVVALSSIVLNSKSNIHCYILTTKLSPENLQKIEAIKSLSASEFTYKIIHVSNDDFTHFPTARRLTHMACARLELHNLVPELDKILYLDCDIIALQDIAELFNCEFTENQLFGACMDYVSPQKAERIKVDYHEYFNSGVLLMNLKRMREIDFNKYCIECLNDDELTIKNDQDLLNAVTNQAQQSWLKLETRWNTFGDVNFKKIRKKKLYKNELHLMKNALKDPAIIHYTGIKPTTYNYRARFNDIFWEYVGKSPAAGLEVTDKNLKNFLLKYFSTPKLQRKFRSLIKRLK